MTITAEIIKELREQTSCGVMECKKALEAAEGDLKKAKEILRERGLELAAKKGSRSAKEGRVEAYIHQGAKIGVILELNCETDFVAATEEFVQFSRDLAMHIAALNPKYISREDVSESALADVEDAESFYKENCLLEQTFIKDSNSTIKNCITDLVAKIGENIAIGRFIRYKVNELSS